MAGSAVAKTVLAQGDMRWHAVRDSADRRSILYWRYGPVGATSRRDWHGAVRRNHPTQDWAALIYDWPDPKYPSHMRARDLGCFTAKRAAQKAVEQAERILA